MGLKSDFTEVVSVWSNSSWRVKVLLALSLFLASSSIASLSEAVFKWRGFIFDAMSFYGSSIRQPLAETLQATTGIHLTKGSMDLAITLSLGTAAMIRAVAYERYRYGLNWRDYIFIFGAIAIMTASIVLKIALMNKFGEEFNSFATVFAVFYWLVYLFFAGSRKGMAGFLGLIALTLPLVMVGLLGAVNAGLSKPVT